METAIPRNLVRLELVHQRSLIDVLRLCAVSLIELHLAVCGVNASPFHHIPCAERLAHFVEVVSVHELVLSVCPSAEVGNLVGVVADVTADGPFHL